MPTFGIVLLSLSFLLLCMSLYEPYRVRRLLLKHGVDRPVETYRARIWLERKRGLKNLLVDDYVLSNPSVLSNTMSLILVVPPIFSYITKEPNFLYIPLVNYIVLASLLLIPSLGRRPLAYMVVEEQALPIMSRFDKVEKNLEELNESTMFKLMRRRIVNTEYLSVLDLMSDKTIDWMRLSKSLLDLKKVNPNSRLFQDEMRERLHDTGDELEQRYAMLYDELFEVEKLFAYSIGESEHPGAHILNQEFQNRDMSNVGQKTSPTIEALTEIVKDPMVEENMKKLALQSIQEIHEKEMDDKRRIQSEIKHLDTFSTIRTARMIHGLVERELHHNEREDGIK